MFRFGFQRLKSASRFTLCLALAAFGALPARAQSSTNINLNLNRGNIAFADANFFVMGQTGSVGSLGEAALVFTSSTVPINNGGLTGPVQITMELAFNERDALSISFTESDPNFVSPTSFMMSGGSVTGGTGAYASATGSLDLTVTKDAAGAGVTWSTSTTTGSGTLVVGGASTPLILTNFRGWCCEWGDEGTPSSPYYSAPLSVSGSLGNATGTMVGYYYFNQTTPSVSGTATIAFNSSDTLILGFSYTPTPNTSILSPSSFTGHIFGGTGKYANANGALAWTTTTNGFTVTSTMTTSPGAVITQVKTVYGLANISQNTWLEVHGSNLVPANTPSTGVDWSNAPDFANGQMPTQLGPVSVSFGGGGTPGYIYWYCSAQTNPNCADDQINVLTPLFGIADPAPMKLTVNNNGVPLADSGPFRAGYSPAFLSFDALGHIAARHLDSSLVGPASLYQGLSTPAKAGETISLYATGFGTSTDPIVAGSATQSGALTTTLSCWVSGFNAEAVGALVSPGLYQINLTVPNGVPSGDHPVECTYQFYSTFPGALIAVQ
jgi:uncharacterized protein (TIGR03437 family)